MIKTALFAAAAAIATVASAAPALAKDVVVRYGDLDLATADGQRTFSQRIDRAAKAACDYQADGRIANRTATECFSKARTQAQTQMASLVSDARLGG